MNQFAVACCAPPLTDELLEQYKVTIDSLPNDELKDALQTLLACSAAWWELPESLRKPIAKVQTPTQEQPIVPLEEHHVEQLDRTTPWMKDIMAMEVLFDQLTGDLRNMAFHLSWHAKELTLDREPLTSDKLKTT